MSNTPNIPGEGIDPWTGKPNGPFGDPWQQPGQASPQGYQDPNASPQGYQDPNAFPMGYQDPNAFPMGQQAPGHGHNAYGQSPAPVLASWGKRAQGFLLDWFVPNLVLNGIWSLVHKAPAADPNTTDPWATYSVSAQAPSLLIFVVIAVTLAFLNKNGQTPGRRWAGTQLVNAQGQPVQAGGPSVLRYLFHFVDDLCLIGWLWPLWDSKRQTFADKLANTQVIDLGASGRDSHQR